MCRGCGSLLEKQLLDSALSEMRRGKDVNSIMWGLYVTQLYTEELYRLRLQGVSIDHSWNDK